MINKNIQKFTMCLLIVYSFLWCGRLAVAALGILFGGSLKNFNKKELEYIELPTQKKKKKLIHEVLQFPSTSIQILNCYIIVYYKYLLPMWVAMSL